MNKGTGKQTNQNWVTTATGAVGGIGAAVGVHYIDELPGNTTGAEALPADDPAGNPVSGGIEVDKDADPHVFNVNQQVGTEGNEVVDGVAFDLDGDGVIDAIALDFDQDGVAEYAGVDTDNDHVADTHLIDMNGDQTYDIAIQEQVFSADSDTGTGNDWENGDHEANSDHSITYDLDNDADISDWV